MPKKPKSLDLSQLLSSSIESAIHKLLTKQQLKAKESISELGQAVRSMEKRLSKLAKPRKPRKKSKAVRKAKAGKKAIGKKICKVKGCKKPRKAKGLCNKHYVAKMRREKRKKYGRKRNY